MPCGDQWSRVVSKDYINLSTVESNEDIPIKICAQANIEDVKKFKRSIEIGQVGVFHEVCTRPC